MATSALGPSVRLLITLLAALLTVACEAPDPAASAPPEAAPDSRRRAAPARTAPPADASQRSTPAPPATPAQRPGTQPQRPAQRHAVRLTAAERAVRDPAVSGAALAAAARTQQQGYRRLASRPRLRAAVVAEVPRALRPAVRANARAAAQLRALNPPVERLPDWRIVSPAPRRRLLATYRRAQRRTGVAWEYLAAIHLVETRMGRIRGMSSAGAQGPMQFMPATWEAYGRGDVHDDGDAVAAAARYLRAHGAPQDMDGALWHYNHSDRYVAAVSAYAEVMREDPRAYRGYHGWEVYVRTRAGDVRLPVGWRR